MKRKLILVSFVAMLFSVVSCHQVTDKREEQKPKPHPILDGCNEAISNLQQCNIDLNAQ